MSTQHQREDKPTDLADDDVYSLLSNSRRRAVLDELHADGPLDAAEVIDRVAAREANGGADAARVRKRVHVSWIQVHEPKLRAADVIREAGDGAYTLGPNSGALLRRMDYSVAAGGVRSYLLGVF